MRQITCDECRIVKDADQWGSSPKGWLTVYGGEEWRQRDYCSAHCAAGAFEKLATPPVSKVEQTIEDAERAGLHPAEFI